VVVSAIGSLLLLGEWIYVRVHGAVEWSRREGPMVVTWVADGQGITRRVMLEPAAGIPIQQGWGISRAFWTVHGDEGFWSGRGEKIDRLFVPAIPTLRGLDIEELKARPGIDITTSWICFYPGRLSATLAMPALAWLAVKVIRTIRHLRARGWGASGRGDLCPGCGYDLRATPARCPECGWLAPVKVDPDELAERLSEVR
jgi:hypothetical protein